MMKTETLKINKERLMAIAEKPSDEAIKRRSQRKSERQLVLASTLIAAKIARAMRMQNIKNVEVAKILGVSPANVTRYLSGKANFELKTLIDIEKALNINLIDRSL